MNMQIDYDPEADAMYVNLRAAKIDDTLEVGQYIFVDVDQDGVPVGLEILFAGRFRGRDATSVTFNISPAHQETG